MYVLFLPIYIEGNVYSYAVAFFNLFLIDIYAPSCYYILVPREQRKTKHVLPSQGGRKENVIMSKKFCTRCGKQFAAIGREVICPACKQAAAEESKKAAVLKAKRASWAGESVPVRISGRASTVIRRYAAAEKSLSFAEALDELLKSTDCFKGMNIKWDEITPYKSHRRDKHTTETAQDTSTAQEVPQASKRAAKKVVKTAAEKGGKE